MLRANRYFSTSRIPRLGSSIPKLNDRSVEKKGTERSEFVQSSNSSEVAEKRSQDEDLSLLENAYKKYEKISSNSLEATYLSSKISPLANSRELGNYMKANKENFLDFRNFNRLPLNFGLNQNISSSNKNLQEISQRFKYTPIKYSFAYGSKVFKQQNNSEPSQTDLILASTFVDHFHSLNLNNNSGHYSFLKFFGSDFVNKVGKAGAGVYFNPYVQMNNQLVKYGVTSVETILDDLLNWNTLYIAGRLQKPVKILKDDARVRFANQENLRNAVALSLLLTKDQTLDEFSLYKTIASLSYQGDLRTKIGGENPNKVTNIIEAQFDQFKQLYQPLIEIFADDQGLSATNGSLAINQDVGYLSKLIQNLPFAFKLKLYNIYASKYPGDQHLKSVLDGTSRIKVYDVFQKYYTSQASSNGVKIHEPEVESAFVRSIASDPQLQSNLTKCLHQTVFYPSVVQSFKGIFTSGFVKSYNYAREKRLKALQK